jgi:Ca-activated chloride channel homolog
LQNPGCHFCVLLRRNAASNHLELRPHAHSKKLVNNASNSPISRVSHLPSGGHTHASQVARILTLFAAGVLTAGPTYAQVPTFHADVNLISLTFSVRGGDGKPVSDLSPSDIEILEDGVPQKIHFFARASDLPLTIGLIVDVSDSQRTFFKQHHRDVEKFLNDVLDPRDQAFLICFGDHIRLVSDLTSSVAQIMDNFQQFEKGRHNYPELGPKEDRREGTALFDAIVHSTGEKLANVQHGRRALVVFSDGEDNSSAYDSPDAIEVTQNADVLLYAVRYTEHERRHLNSRNKYGIRVMQRLGRETGGLDFDASADTDLDPLFKQIGAELHSLYAAGYHSSNPLRDGTFRKVVIRPTKPGVTIRAKSGYFAQK